MKRYQVVRTHISPYQHQDFLGEEKAIVEKFSSLEYRSPENISDLDVILLTNTHTKLQELSPKLLKQTRLIIHPNSGYDHFSRDIDLWRNIPVVIGHTIRAQAVAEYSLGAMFEGLMNLPQHLVWSKDRKWDRTLLKETSVWIFGYGHIGKIIYNTLTALGLKVTVVDPFVENSPVKALKSFRDGNLREAKVVICACSLNDTSTHMFNEGFFKEASPDLLFINGARGKLVEEKALKDFLLTHPDAFAFLDVFNTEPFGEEWHGFPQVWKTSHIAGVEKDLDQKILRFEAEVLKSYLELEAEDFFRKYRSELLQNKWIKGVLV